MARVTRSMVILEDHTANQKDSPQVPIPGANVLTEIHNSMTNVQIDDDDALASEVKGLKAAYKASLGIGKRGKKNRSRSKPASAQVDKDTAHQLVKAVTIIEKIPPTAKEQVGTRSLEEDVPSKEELEPATIHETDNNEDSFVRVITSRSPAKPVSRIEDSVEALDQLEEALEALNQAALAEHIVSPVKQKLPRTPEAPTSKQQQDAFKAGIQSAKFSASTMRVKATAPRQSVLKKATSMNFKPAVDLDRSSSAQENAHGRRSTTLKRPASLVPPKPTIKSTKPLTRPTFELSGDAVARKLKEQKEVRMAQRTSSEDTFYTARTVSGPKVKSTKPPTKPDFELPGEAISRKKKEAQEARLKAQEEEERKRRQFKAKPVRTSIVPDFVPRMTITSLARQGKPEMGGEDGLGFKRISNVGPHRTDNGLGSKKIPNVGSHRLSAVGAHRPSISDLNKANTSAPRAKASGREIYKREAQLAEEMERAKREREAAAKRAREEAAERGRQASREWAEKQMAKKLASA